MKGYRTILFNLLTAAIPVLEASGIVDYIPDHLMVWYVLGMASANILLRLVTTTPVGKKI